MFSLSKVFEASTRRTSVLIGGHLSAQICTTFPMFPYKGRHFRGMTRRVFSSTHFHPTILKGVIRDPRSSGFGCMLSFVVLDAAHDTNKIANEDESPCMPTIQHPVLTSIMRLLPHGFGAGKLPTHNPFIPKTSTIPFRQDVHSWKEFSSPFQSKIASNIFDHFLNETSCLGYNLQHLQSFSLSNTFRRGDAPRNL